MPDLSFRTVDVFTERRFGGYPLAVVLGAQELDGSTMQAIASEFNLSETTFVLPPLDAANTARVRIFNRTAEMLFAGHPIVGTAFALATAMESLDDLAFEVPAGLVRVRVARGTGGQPVVAEVAAPQPLSIGEEVPANVVAGMLRLSPDDVIVSNHLPVVASVGNPYVIAKLTEPAMGRCDPDSQKFREALQARPSFGDRLSLHVYHRAGHDVRARMFAPLAGTWEDPATGSANAPLACLLLSLDGDQMASFAVRQGVEMGRPSFLRVTARRQGDRIEASLFGTCVHVMKGEITLA